MILYILLPFLIIPIYAYFMGKIKIYDDERKIYYYIAPKRDNTKAVINFYEYYKAQIAPEFKDILKWAIFYAVIEELIFRFLPMYFLPRYIGYDIIILVGSMIFGLLHFLNIKVFGRQIISIYGKDIKEEEKPVLFFGLFLLSNYLFNFYLNNSIWFALGASIITHFLIIIAVGINQIVYTDSEVSGNTLLWDNGHKLIKSPILWAVLIIPTYQLYFSSNNSIALIINLIFKAVTTIGIYLFANWVYSTDINVLDGFNTEKEITMLGSFFTYPIWALIQQIIVLVIFMILSNFLHPIIVIPITAIIFSIVHIRNKVLAIGCFILEIILLTLYYFHRNIYILAITHGWVATCGLYMLPSKLHNNFNI